MVDAPKEVEVLDDGCDRDVSPEYPFNHGYKLLDSASISVGVLPYHQFFKRVVGEDKSVETRDPEKFSKNHWSRWYLGIIVVFGFFHIDTWPFAVYPSFGNPVEPITWHVSLEYKRSDGFHKVNLIGDQKLRKWLPKTRLLGLHKQLLSKDPKSISKLKALDRFYCEALSLNMDQPRTYIKRKKNITTGEILDSCVLLDLP